MLTPKGNSFATRVFGLQVVIKDDGDLPSCYLLRDPSLLIGGDWSRDAMGMIDHSRISNLTRRSDEAWRGNMTCATHLIQSRLRKFDTAYVHVETIDDHEIEEFEGTWYGEEGPMEDEDGEVSGPRQDQA